MKERSASMGGRRGWGRTATFLLLAGGATLSAVAGCLDDDEDGNGTAAGASGEAGAAGESSSSGGSLAGSAGSAGKGGSGAGGPSEGGMGGKPEAGAPSAGEGGAAAAPTDGGAAGAVGAAGGAECEPASETCITPGSYCDAQVSCPAPSAGCSNNTCLPGLALTAACTTAGQCSSGFCDGTGHCAEPPTCCQASACAPGWACVHVPLSFPCALDGGQECRKPGEATAGGFCDFNLPCAPGYACWDDSNPNGAWHCAGPTRQVGQSCRVSDGQGSIEDPSEPPYFYDCADSYCPLPAGGVGSCDLCTTCTAFPKAGESCDVKDASGHAVRCEPSAYCGADKLCHPRGQLGETCDAAPCLASLLCAAKANEACPAL